MGRESIKLDDNVLAHLETVIITKLRRGEPFVFTWVIDPSLGSGRMSRWVHPQSDIDFRFEGRQSSSLNPAWVESLMSTANSPGGLRLVPEPASDR